ncbi:MAG: hypothetical protein WBW74_07910 [Xanthobacteraceae bacterium]
MRHESESQAGCDHGEDPVIAVAAIDSFDLRAVAGKNVARQIDLLAVDAVEVALAVEVAHAHRIVRSQPMLQTHHDEELLAEERQTVEPFVDPIRPAVDCGLQRAIEQPGL